MSAARRETSFRLLCNGRCMPTVAKVSGPAASAEVCSQCGHGWGDHLMHPAVYPYPTDGWITCPLQACTCRNTWSVEEHARPVFEARRKEFSRKSPADGSNWLRELDALYLFGTIGTEAILRGNGEVWVRPDEHWGGCQSFARCRRLDQRTRPPAHAVFRFRLDPDQNHLSRLRRVGLDRCAGHLTCVAPGR